MTTLTERLNQINAANQAWMNEDPVNRWSGMLTLDLNHWLDYGITTAEGLDEYLDACAKEHSDEYKRDMLWDTM